MTDIKVMDISTINTSLTESKKDEILVGGPSVVLSSGARIPLLGLGTFRSQGRDVQESVEVALSAGYRHIDTASMYENEMEIGGVLSKWLSAGKIKREELYITSKLWNVYHRPDRVKEACLRCLQYLQLKYLDLFLIHWPVAFGYIIDEKTQLPKSFPVDKDGKLIFDTTTSLEETWKSMEQLVDAGLVRSIGVSNFNAQQIGIILACCRIRPAVNQIEVHPALTQKSLRDYCVKQNIHVTAYGPLGSPWRPNLKKVLISDPIVMAIANQHKVSPAQVLIKWCLSYGMSCIPKSVTPDRIRNNLNIFGFELNEEDKAALDKLNCDLRFVSPTWLKSF